MLLHIIIITYKQQFTDTYTHSTHTHTQLYYYMNIYNCDCEQMMNY